MASFTVSEICAVPEGKGGGGRHFCAPSSVSGRDGGNGCTS